MEDSGEAIRHFGESIRIVDELVSGKFMLQESYQTRFLAPGPGATLGAIRHRSVIGLAAMHLRGGDPRTSLDVIRLPLALLPTDFYGQRYFALSLAAIGDLAAASASWQKQVEFPERRFRTLPEGSRRNPGRAAVWSNPGLGQVMGNPFHLNLGDTAAAIRRHRNAVATAKANILESADALGRSDLASALNDLGGSLLDENPVESVETYRKAIGEWEKLLKAAPRNRE
jgi:tetratricopeptide (TPR) repeat protein